MAQVPSGKSTILKLMCRLYDPSEGNILVDGQDIRTLKLHDLRNTIACLFQDYTLFPLSVCPVAVAGLRRTDHSGLDLR